MNEFYYTFGYKNGIPSEIRDALWAENAINNLFEKILTPEDLKKRRIIKAYRDAISQIAQEIVEQRV